MDPNDTIKYKIGGNWTANNILTLIQWIYIGAYYIECLELSIKRCKTYLRRNVIYGLLISTLAGTLNITQFNMIENDLTNIIIKGILTFSTYSIAFSSGIIKIFQFQEKLENHIKVKQQWISFVVSIGTELQLPYNLRQDALYLIKSNKEKYLDLLRIEYEIPDDIKKIISYDMNKETPTDILGIKISQIIINILKNEKEIISKIIEDPLYDGNMDICDYYLKKKTIDDSTPISNIKCSNEVINKNSHINKIPILNNFVKSLLTKKENNNQVHLTRFSPSLNYFTDSTSLPLYNSPSPPIKLSPGKEEISYPTSPPTSTSSTSPPTSTSSTSPPTYISPTYNAPTYISPTSTSPPTSTSSTSPTSTSSTSPTSTSSTSPTSTSKKHQSKNITKLP
jgi:hypothetical protein